MSKVKMFAVVAAGAAVVTVAALATLHAQRPAATTLTMQDYNEIQQLVARYSYALDTGENDGYMYADLFTPDGTFGRLVGREKIAAMVRDGHKNSGWDHINNLITNVIVEPTAEGATGKQYAVAIDVSTKPNTIYHTGHYNDVYVKTPAGWRFKSRTFVGHSGNAPAQAPH